MLRLSPRGIFPIVFDRQGKRLTDLPATGYLMPGTIQGEGKLAGVTSLFIRTWGCNLNCCWTLPDGELSYCDTQESITQKSLSEVYSIDEIVSMISHNLGSCKHIVITGGEPLLQKASISELISRLKALDLHITIETNGTQFDSAVLEQCDLISLSPKLSSSLTGRSMDVDKHLTKLRSVLEQVVALRAKDSSVDFQLKFVASSDQDILEIEDLVKDLEGIKGEDILLMPLGGTAAELQKTTAQAVEMTIKKGWRFAPRLHVMQWNDKAGV